ncbi:MAG: hypothetical protein IKY83_12855 [Proteobacteria bacterium]|nr:hypothetical protein [Pseudomonadota bacterium]
MSPITFKGFGYAKALIFGEYAVMDGFPGLAAALPQTCQVTIHCDPLHAAAESCKSDHIFSLEYKFEQLFRELTGNSASIQISLDSFFDDQDRKLGIGSSAAAIVAMNLATCEYLRCRPRISDMIRMHRDIQNQMGSGIDIIASYAGGCILASNCPHQPDIERIETSALPHFAVFSLHTPAPTLQYIEAARRAQHDARYQSVLSALGETYIELAKCVRAANTSAFLDILHHIPPLLRSLGDILMLPVWPDIMNDISAIAHNHHVTVKTSGAGGGDIILAISDHPDDLENFSKELTAFSKTITRIPSHIPPQRGELLL